MTPTAALVTLQNKKRGKITNKTRNRSFVLTPEAPLSFCCSTTFCDSAHSPPHRVTYSTTTFTVRCTSKRTVFETQGHQPRVCVQEGLAVQTKGCVNEQHISTFSIQLLKIIFPARRSSGFHFTSVESKEGGAWQSEVELF